MAQVTYRGVKYDTDAHKEVKTEKSELNYRGHKYVKLLTTYAR